MDKIQICGKCGQVNEVPRSDTKSDNVKSNRPRRQWSLTTTICGRQMRDSLTCVDSWVHNILKQSVRLNYARTT